MLILRGLDWVLLRGLDVATGFAPRPQRLQVQIAHFPGAICTVFQVQFAPFSRCNLHHICTIFGANPCANCTRYLHHFGANCTSHLHHFWCKLHIGFAPLKQVICTKKSIFLQKYTFGWCKSVFVWCKSNVQFAPKMVQITCAICTEMVQIKCAICTCICTILVQILVQIRCKWHWDLHHFGANMSANGIWICTILVQILVQTRCIEFALLGCKSVPQTQF